MSLHIGGLIYIRDRQSAVVSVLVWHAWVAKSQNLAGRNARDVRRDTSLPHQVIKGDQRQNPGSRGTDQLMIK